MVKRLLCGNAKDARKLVAQRAAAIDRDIGRRERESVSLARQERPERELFGVAEAEQAETGGAPPGDGGSTGVPGARVSLGCLGLDQQLVQRGGLEDLALEAVDLLEAAVLWMELVQVDADVLGDERDNPRLHFPESGTV